MYARIHGGLRMSAADVREELVEGLSLARARDLMIEIARLGTMGQATKITTYYPLVALATPEVLTGLLRNYVLKKMAGTSVSKVNLKTFTEDDFHFMKQLIQIPAVNAIDKGLMKVLISRKDSDDAFHRRKAALAAWYVVHNRKTNAGAGVAPVTS